jgi:hypothetical protein
MALALVYDPRYKTFTEWAYLMCEAYAGQQLEIPNSDDEWQTWAAGLVGIDLFTNEAIPDPYKFKNWDDWATVLVNNVNQKVN